MITNGGHETSSAGFPNFSPDKSYTNKVIGEPLAYTIKKGFAMPFM